MYKPEYICEAIKCEVTYLRHILITFANIFFKTELKRSNKSGVDLYLKLSVPNEHAAQRQHVLKTTSSKDQMFNIVNFE